MFLIVKQVFSRVSIFSFGINRLLGMVETAIEDWRERNQH